MGRFNSSVVMPQAIPQTQIPTYASSNYSSGGYQGNQQYQFSSDIQQQQAKMQEAQRQWPTVFPKNIVGLERDGTIIEDIGTYITDFSQVKPIPGSLEAIRMLRLKGHRLTILTNQSGIYEKKQTIEQVDEVHNGMMRMFGEAGIFSIDGLYYSTSSLKNDIFAKPNIGMFNRARDEQKVNWKQGWYVGDKLADLKAADRAGAKPILVLTGNGQKTLTELNTFANRVLKSKTNVFDNLLAFAQSI
jgi:D-glycero-D-manno-heptose 1,7-bisphosphate phosphatase